MTYLEKLRDPRWQKKRLEILDRDGFICNICCDGTKMLVVHHKYYVSNREPWDYPGFAYVVLCDPCHQSIRDNKINDIYDFEIALQKACPTGHEMELANLCFHYTDDLQGVR